MPKGLFLPIFLLLYAFPFFGMGQHLPAVNKGVLDLREYDFASQGSLPLDGEWNFYWKSLRDSTDADINGVLVKVPGVWNDLEVTDGEAFGYGTYELQIILPEARPGLAIQMPDMYSSYQMYINGVGWSANGKVARSKEEYIPKFTPLTRSLNSSADTLNIRISIANFDHSKGGLGQSIKLGTFELFQDRVLHVSLDIFLTGSLIMGGLFFLGLYLFGNQSQPIFYFSLFCVVWGYRIIASGIYALHSLFDLPWLLTLRLEYISMFLAALLFTRYVYFLYPQDFNAKLEKVFLIAFGSLSLIALFFPPYIFTQTVEVFFVIVIPGFVAMVVTHIRSWVNKRNVSIYSMFSIFVIFFVFMYFFLSYFGYVRGSVYVTFLGSIIFVFLQSLVLSFRYSRELKDAKEIAEQASTAKMEFLSTMSHEIRTPLNAVIGLSNFLIEENPRDDQRDSLDNLRFASENLLSLINDILDYNKIDAGKIDLEEKPFNIRRLIAGTIAAYKHIADEKGVELRHRIDEHVPEVIVSDITRLSQILTNLIGNAIKFTKEGYIEVSVMRVARAKEKVALRFSVEDTGVGIPQDKQKVIFESFTQATSATTREFGGSGLGLAITDKLLGLMGSKLHLKSKVGVGSMFYFTQFFDVSEVAIEHPERATKEKTTSLEGCRVLIVEDTAVNIMVAQKFLEKWGMAVDSVENGFMAVEKVKNNVYDIILMDLQMPVMDGYEATRLIRGAGISTPIIALTAAAVSEVVERIQSVGMNAYVTKPFNPVVLHDKMKALLNHANPEME